MKEELKNKLTEEEAKEIISIIYDYKTQNRCACAKKDSPDIMRQRLVEAMGLITP